jgi:hypothetical protein
VRPLSNGIADIQYPVAAGAARLGNERSPRPDISDGRHGWIDAICDGLLRDLSMTVTGPDQWRERHASAIAALGSTG